MGFIWLFARLHLVPYFGRVRVVKPNRERIGNRETRETVVMEREIEIERQSAKKH